MDEPGLTDIHAHPAMNAWLWDRNLRRHYWTGTAFDPLASLTDFKMLEKGEVKVLWSALHIPEHAYFDCWILRLLAHLFRGGRMLLHDTPWQCLLSQMAEMEEQVAASEHFELARSNDEFDRVVAAGHTAIVHTVEGGHVLGADLEPDDIAGHLERLVQLADHGVAALTLAHLFPNDLAGHVDAIPLQEHKIFLCKTLDAKVEPDKALTPTGAALVDKMVDLRMIVDVAHCTPNARDQVYSIVNNRAPVIASHVGVQTMNSAPYNLRESDVRAIKASGGVAGVIFMPYWLVEKDTGPGLDAIWKTMKQIHDWSGGTWDHVAIGTDFDGFTDPPDDCDSEGQLPKVEKLLADNGVTGADAAGVLGGNARRVLRSGWR
jgi:microsomal dipeptidase-like Zn-dependent dipeptidase